MVKQLHFTISTAGRETINLTAKVRSVITESGIKTGTCHVFLAHTSASLMLCENADPDVRHDLETFMTELVKDGDPKYRHHDEGPDDMSAHIRTVLTNPDLTIPVVNGKCGLGIWQDVYLWEHRAHSQQRTVIVTVQGE